MAYIAVTYSFSNSSTADATQVNQNFQDIIDGLSNGTKDLSVNAVTAAGNLTVSGNTTLGNASSDTVTVTGSLASSIPIGTTNSYDIGSSTLGLRALYFGANSQTVNIKGSSSMSATWTLTLPVSAGTSGYFLSTNGSGVTSWTDGSQATLFSTGLGSVSAPAHTFTSDLNTGMWSSAADTLNFSAGGVEAMRMLSSGNVAMGATASLSFGHESWTSNFLMQGSQGIAAYRSSADIYGGILVLAKSRSGATVNSGDRVGEIVFAPHDGTDLTNTAAIIRCEVDATPGSNDTPGRILFMTTADGANSPTERCRIDNKGNMIMGGGALGTGATDGFMYISQMGGAPTGVPTGSSGMVPLVYDSGSNKLYVYNSGWKSVTLA